MMKKQFTQKPFWLKTFIWTRRMQLWLPCHGIFTKLSNFFSDELQEEYLKDKLFKKYCFRLKRSIRQVDFCYDHFDVNLTRNSETISFQSPRLMKIHSFFGKNDAYLKTFLGERRIHFWKRCLKVFFWILKFRRTRSKVMNRNIISTKKIIYNVPTNKCKKVYTFSFLEFCHEVSNIFFSKSKNDKKI